MGYVGCVYVCVCICVCMYADIYVYYVIFGYIWLGFLYVVWMVVSMNTKIGGVWTICMNLKVWQGCVRKIW